MSLATMPMVEESSRVMVEMHRTTVMAVADPANNGKMRVRR